MFTLVCHIHEAGLDTIVHTYIYIKDTYTYRHIYIDVYIPNLYFQGRLYKYATYKRHMYIKEKKTNNA